MEPISKFDSIEQQRTASNAISAFMTKVYGWMCFALFLTAITAWTVVNNEGILYYIFSNTTMLWGIIIAELVLVIVISAAIEKLSPQIASLLFVVYSILTGVTLSLIFIVYTSESIATTFGVTAATFGAMSLFGMITKKDLSRMGSILYMALIGLIIATVVNLFWANSALYWITTYAGVIIFVGLTAYDTQKLKHLALQVNEEETAIKLSILGALNLYLDFINMFLYLLRIFGNKK